MGQEISPGKSFRTGAITRHIGRRPGETGRIQSHPRLHPPRHQNPQQQCQRGHDLKIDKGLQSNPSGRAQAGHAGHAQGHRKKHDGTDEPLDDRDKSVAQQLELNTGCG